MGRKATVTNFRTLPLYPRITRAVATLLAKDKVVRPVDVLIEMQLLKREHLEDWRRGRVPYLERVIDCNLSRLSTLLRVLRFHAHDLNLKPSFTAYMRHTRGPKHKLRFSKTGDPHLEEAYATHLIWPGKEPFPIERLRSLQAADEGREAAPSSASVELVDANSRGPAAS